MLTYHEHLEALDEHGWALLACATNMPAARQLRACPDWTVTDMIHHVGWIWDFWAWVVENGVTERADVLAKPDPPRPADAELQDWARGRLNHLQDVLARHQMRDPAYSFTGRPRDVAWVARRVAHESAVHRLDLEEVAGHDLRLDPALAADGVDEFLTALRLRHHAEEPEPVSGTIHLHATDTEGEWFVGEDTGAEDALLHEHRFGDTGVRGPAQQLLRWLWRREPADVELYGDVDVARRFRAWSNLQ